MRGRMTAPMPVVRRLKYCFGLDKSVMVYLRWNEAETHPRVGGMRAPQCVERVGARRRPGRGCSRKDAVRAGGSARQGRTVAFKILATWDAADLHRQGMCPASCRSSQAATDNAQQPRSHCAVTCRNRLGKKKSPRREGWGRYRPSRRAGTARSRRQSDCTQTSRSSSRVSSHWKMRSWGSKRSMPGSRPSAVLALASQSA